MAGRILRVSAKEIAAVLHRDGFVCVRQSGSHKIDLLRKDFRGEISLFRARRSENYEAYTAYMLNNFREAAAEIGKLQQKNIYAAGLIYKSHAGKRVTIPFHGRKILRPKLLRNICDDMGITLEGLEERL